MEFRWSLMTYEIRFSLAFFLLAGIQKRIMEINHTMTVTLSQNGIRNLNMNRKRAINPQQWLDNAAKFRRNSGQPYVSRKGLVDRPARLAPVGKSCWVRCNFPGCLTEEEERQEIFEGYYTMSNYESQMTYLLSCITWNPEVPSVYRYYLTFMGTRLEVCRTTFMKTFDIKRGTVKYLQDRIQGGQRFVKDGRGKHGNHHKADPNITQEMELHIDGFQKYETHYSRRRNGDFYLSPDLSLSKMFRHFLEAHPNRPEMSQKGTAYREAFRKSGLHIGQPRSDTCKTCDSMNIELLAANLPEERLRVESRILEHHISTDAGYVHLNIDIERSVIDSLRTVLRLSFSSETQTEEYHGNG